MCVCLCAHYVNPQIKQLQKGIDVIRPEQQSKKKKSPLFEMSVFFLNVNAFALASPESLNMHETNVALGNELNRCVSQNVKLLLVKICV